MTSLVDPMVTLSVVLLLLEPPEVDKQMDRQLAYRSPALAAHTPPPTSSTLPQLSSYE